MFDFLKKILLTIMLAAIPFVSTAQEKCPEYMFYIDKSDNKNVLYYAIKMDEKDKEKINSKKPLDIYWIMYAEKGQREGFAIGEEGQFGIKHKEIEKGTKFIINVNSKLLNKRDITITLKENGCAEAVTKIEGKEAILKSISIDIPSKSFGLPNVSHLDIKGAALANGSELNERVINPDYKAK